MAVKVKIPTMLLKLTGNKNEVGVSGRTVREMIDQLEKKHPGMRELLLTPDGGAINHHFLICINEEDVRYLDQLDTSLSPGDRVEIVASIAGGSYSRFRSSSTTKSANGREHVNPGDTAFRTCADRP